MTETNKLTSDDIKPGPFSREDLRRLWRQQADPRNDWDSLGIEKQLAWAQTCAIEADRKKNQQRLYRLQQENHRFREPECTILCDLLANGELLPDPSGTRYGLKAELRPLADGEMTAAIKRLSSMAEHMEPGSQDRWAIENAAFLLQQRHPAPVVASERPWEREGWCDADGNCWIGHPEEVYSLGESGDYDIEYATWRLETPPIFPCKSRVSLPAGALPIPNPSDDSQP